MSFLCSSHPPASRFCICLILRKVLVENERNFYFSQTVRDTKRRVSRHGLDHLRVSLAAYFFCIFFYFPCTPSQIWKKNNFLLEFFWMIIFLLHNHISFTISFIIFRASAAVVVSDFYILLSTHFSLYRGSLPSDAVRCQHEVRGGPWSAASLLLPSVI